MQGKSGGETPPLQCDSVRASQRKALQVLAINEIAMNWARQASPLRCDARASTRNSYKTDGSQMTINSKQLAALLETFDGPARLFNASGMVLAQNEMARGETAAQSDSWGASTRHDLGDGMTLQLWNGREQFSPRAASGEIESGLATLANSMAHSIRNPLSSIVTAAKLIGSDENLSEETQMLLEVVQKESKQLDFLLTDFLHYVRPQKIALTQLDIGKIVAQTILVLQRDGVLTPQLKIENVLPAGLTARGDEVQIGRALRNVLRNAAQAMLDEGGALRINGEYAQNDGTLQLFIGDSGGGFSQEDLQRAYEPFYSNTPEGAGLGLPIARDAIERCGGTLHLENDKDGACVVITLPAAHKNA